MVTRATTLAPTPTPPFELHLATSNQTTRVVDGQGHPGTFEYQVLNACRAWRFVEENLLCSKLDGGRWARTRVDDPAVIEPAIARQRGRPAQPPDGPAVTAFVQDILHRLHHELATAAQPADQPTPEQHSAHRPGHPHSTDADQRRVGR